VNESGDPVIAFFAAIGDRLEDCVRHFKADNEQGALVAMEQAVALCESNPSYAVTPNAELGSSLRRVVHACISNAIAKGRSSSKMAELLTRIEAVAERAIH
jgi:hypothetical protein